MRTQLEINQYLQNTTVKNARHLLDIELCIRNNNLHLPNNVIIHENGITFDKFLKWFNNICFKEGDIIICSFGHIHLLMDSTTSYLHLDITHNALGMLDKTLTLGISIDRYATEEEKQKLFDVIKTKGYKWNSETKTLEKLIKPKFKVGDRIKKGEKIVTIIKIYKNCYYVNYDSGIGSFTIDLQDEWKLVSNKFDITILKPFDKVLVRDYSYEQWSTAVYSHKQNGHFVASGHFNQCIPYEGNEHLLGTSNDCDDFYKTWE